MSLTILIPKGSSTASIHRTPQYIPSNTGSMTLTLLSNNGAAPTAAAATQGPFNLTPPSATNPNPSCTAVSSGTSCSFQISAPVGTDIFVADTYASSNGTGTSLGSGAIKLSVTANATNTASLSLSGPVASVSLFSGATTFYNGNPDVPSATPTPYPSSPPESYRRQQGAHTSGVRVPEGPSPTPTTTPPPVNSQSRIFVIALDAAGNQIINPTTFDIPIQVQLNYNGAAAGSLTLTATYSGLPGEPSAAASTTTNGGTVTVYAPTDQVSLAVQNGVYAYGHAAPSLVADYTPQGGTAQTSAPLTYTEILPPPAPVLAATQTSASTLVNGVAAPLTVTVSNTGTAATSGQIEVDDYLGFNFTYGYPYQVGGIEGSPVTFTGTNSAIWTCYPPPDTSYPYATCTTNASIAPGASLSPIVVNVTPDGTQTTTGAVADAYGGGVYYNAYAVDSFSVNPNPTPALGLSFQTPNSFVAGTVGSFTTTVLNTGSAATSGTLSLAVALPANFTYDGATGTGWGCSISASVVSCTSSAAIAADSAGAPVTISVTPQTPALAVSPITFLETVSGGGAASYGSVATSAVPVYGPFTFTGSTSVQFTQACGTASCSVPLGLSETNFPASNYTVNYFDDDCGVTVDVDTIDNLIIPLGGGICHFTVSDDHSDTTPQILVTVTTLSISPNARGRR